MLKKEKSPTAPAGETDVVEALCDLLNASQRLLLRLGSDGRMEPLGVSDWLLLREVGKGGDVPIAALAIRLGVTRQRIQKQVAGLARSGLLAVIVSGTEKRRRLVQLNERGRQKLDELDQLVRSKLSEGGQGPTEEQIGRAARISKRLAITWQRLGPQAEEAAPAS